MRYLIDHFLKPGAEISRRTLVRPGFHVPPEFVAFTCDHTLTGGFHAEGEERNDNWTLIVEDNKVRRVEEHVELPDPEQSTWTVERVDVGGTTSPGAGPRRPRDGAGACP